MQRRRRESIVPAKTGNTLRAGRINAKLVLIVVIGSTVLAVGAYVSNQLWNRYHRGAASKAAEEAYERGDWDEAYRQYTRYFDYNQKDPEAMVKCAKAVLRREPPTKEHAERAAKLLRYSLEFRPDNLEVHPILARLYLTELNITAGATWVAKQWRERAPEDPEAAFWLAAAYERVGKPDDAKKVLKDLTHVDPETGKPLAYVNAHKDKHPTIIKAHKLLADLLAQDRHYKDCKDALDRAVEADPDSPWPWLYRAGICATLPPFTGSTKKILRRSALTDLREADALAEKVLAKKPENARDAMLMRQMCGEWIRHQDSKKAATYLAKARAFDEEVIREDIVNINEWRISLFFMAARLGSLQGQVDDATAEGKALLAKTTRPARKRLLLRELVHLHITDGNTAEARKHLDDFEKLTAESSDTNDATRAELGVIRSHLLAAEADECSNQGRNDDADAKIAEALQIIEPLAVVRGDSETVRTLAYLHGRANDWPSAHAALAGYHTADGDGAEWLIMAVKCARLEKWLVAKEAARIAEELGAGVTKAQLLQIRARLYLAIDAPFHKRQRVLADLDKRLLAMNQDDANIQREVLATRGKVLLYSGQTKQASALLTEAVAKLPDRLDLKLQLATAIAANDDTPGAIAILTEACRLHSESPDAWTSLTQQQVRAGTAEQAKQTLDRGIEAVPDGPGRLKLRICRMWWDLHYDDRVGAIKDLTDCAKKNPENVEVAGILLDLPEIRADKAAAQDLLDRVEEQKGSDSRMWRGHRIQLWLSETNWKDRGRRIIETLEQWSKEDPDWEGLVVGLTHAYLGMEDTDRAEETCRAALKRNPSAARAGRLLAELLAQQGRHADAKEVLDALEGSPESVALWQAQASLYSDDVEDRIQRLKRLIASKPGHLAAHIYLANLTWSHLHDLDAALAYLDKAEKAHPGSLLLLRIRAGLLIEADKATDARRLLDQRVQRESSGHAHAVRARLLERLGDRLAAEDAWKQVIKLAPTGRHYAMLASFYATEARLDNAVQTLRDGLEANQNDADLRFGLAHILWRRQSPGDLDDADAVLADLPAQALASPACASLKATIQLARNTPAAIEEAKALLRLIIKDQPSAIRPYLRLARISLRERDYPEASAALNRALEVNPDNELLLSELRRVQAIREKDRRTAEPEGQVLLKVAKMTPGEAIVELEKYLTDNKDGPATARILAGLANLHIGMNDATGAARWLDRAQKAAPNDPTVLIAQINLWRVHDRLPQIATFAAAYSATKDPNADVLNRAALALASSGNASHLPLAKKLCLLVAQLQPWSPEHRRILATMAYGAGKINEAERRFRNVVRLDRTNVRAFNDLAWLLSEDRGNPLDALPLAEQAVRLAPKERYTLDTRGVILAQVPGRLADAKRDFLACLELARTPKLRAKTLLRLAGVCAKLKEQDQAKVYLDEAAKMDAAQKVLTDQQRKLAAEIRASLAQP